MNQAQHQPYPCPYCGHELRLKDAPERPPDADDPYRIECAELGIKVEEVMYCPACGNEIAHCFSFRLEIGGMERGHYHWSKPSIIDWKSGRGLGPKPDVRDNNARE